jgi:hypothetical protein
VFFDMFEAVTRNTILYNFGCSFNSVIARNSVTMLTLITKKNGLAEWTSISFTGAFQGG